MGSRNRGRGSNKPEEESKQDSLLFKHDDKMRDDQPDESSGEFLFSGHWRTHGKGTRTAITWGLAQPRVFKLHCPAGDQLYFSVYVDGRVAPTNFVSGSTVIVEGSNIEVEQEVDAATPEILANCTWTMVGTPPTDTIEGTWRAESGPEVENRNTLLTALAQPRLFLLSFDRATPPSDTAIEVYSGQKEPLEKIRGQFFQGSSMIGYGSQVWVRYIGASGSQLKGTFVVDMSGS